MRVKRTKSGKFSIEVGLSTREFIFSKVMEFLHDQSPKVAGGSLKTEADVMHQLHYSVINQLMMRKQMFLPFNTASDKLLLHRSEAIALMWMLRKYDDNIMMLELKSNLHKQLN